MTDKPLKSQKWSKTLVRLSASNPKLMAFEKTKWMKAVSVVKYLFIQLE